MRSHLKIRLWLGLAFLILSTVMSTGIVFAAAQSIPPNARIDWQIQGMPSTSSMANESGTKVYDVDPDQVNGASGIATLKATGAIVICYFSAGSAENWRSDYGQFQTSELLGPLDNWPGEQKIAITDNVKSIMTARIQKFASMGCDGVEPDNTDQVADPASYIQWLSGVAHPLGLSVALKNNAELAGNPAIIAATDFLIAEECYEMKECDSYLPFIQAGKAVFDFEYKQAPDCADANAKNIDAYRMSENLDGSQREPCRTSGTPSGSPVASAPGASSGSPTTGSQPGASTLPAQKTWGNIGAVEVAPNPKVTAPPKTTCGVLPPEICDLANTSNNGGGAISVLSFIIKLLAVGVGIVVLIGIVLGGILYASAEGNTGQVQKAKTMILDAIIGLFLFLFLFAIMNFFVPGGLFS